MRRNARRRLTGAVALAFLTACTRTPASDAGRAVDAAGGDDREARDGAAATITADASPARASLTGTDAGPRPRAPCRALVVRGGPRLAGGDGDAGARIIALGDALPGWVALDAPGDTVTAKLPRTGREVTVAGAGRARPCADDEGEAWLVRGAFQGGRGGGETPGGEEWVVTPFGVVRYGAAVLDVTVDATSARVTLKGGAAAVLGEGKDTWEAAGAAAPLVVQGPPLGEAGARAAAARCDRTRAAAKALEDTLLAPGATRAPAFAATAMQANDARVLARATCAVAALRAEAGGAR